MTKCEKCKQQDATIHISKVVNNRKEELHLCEICAKEYSDAIEHVFSNPKIVGVDVSATLTKQIENLARGFSQEKRKVKKCPKCGLTLQEFIKTGKLGCPNDYELFKEELKSVIERLQGGSSKHTGKFPRGTTPIKQKIEVLEQEMSSAVKSEDYERAAQIRDQIKSLRKE